MITKQELERFNSKWVKSGDCHLWQSPLDKDGYGSFYFKKKGRRAHRVAYYIALGAIGDGMVIDHTCKNRHCVNVDHLRQVTPRENALINSNSVAALNAKRTQCIHGHDFDRFFGNRRYCSTCESNKKKRLVKRWKAEADYIAC